MKKLITIVLLALSLTTIKISAAQERIYYDFTYGDGVYYDLDTGIARRTSVLPLQTVIELGATKYGLLAITTIISYGGAKTINILAIITALTPVIKMINI
jgi:hypothetical protein